MIKSVWFFKESMFHHCGKMILSIEACYWDPIQYVETFLWPEGEGKLGSMSLSSFINLLIWILSSNAEKAEQPTQPNSTHNHECRVIYTNVHPYMLLTQLTITCYTVEAINIQIFSQDYLQTIDPEQICKITSYDRIYQY